LEFIKGITRLVIAVLMIGAVIVVGLFVFTSVSPVLSLPKSSSNASAQPVIFEIQPGESVDQIADHLQKQGIIDSSFFFTLRLRLRGAASSLKAGRFQLTPGMDTDKLIDTLSTSPAEIGLRFTVIEGTRLEEISEKLSAAGIVSASNFLKLAATPDGAAQFSDDFLASSGRPADKGLEGFLFPDTYEIKQDGSDNSDAVIRIMLKTMEDKITPDMRKAIADRGLNVYKVLTVASIVQREGVLKDELPDIASVFWNRLDQGMALQADPTTQYAVAKPGAWWPDLDKIGVLPKDVDNPYNTYRIQGLPPGPICNPGLPAIQAAIYPAQTNYLYFVAKNDGTGAHAFAETLEEHERNQVIYQNK
jgi:UPF0755 protein